PAMPPALPQAAQPAVAAQAAVAAGAPNPPAAETAATPPAAPSLPQPLPSTGGTPQDGGEAAEPPATAPAQPQPLAAAEHGAALHAAAQAHIAARQAVGNPAPASLPAAAQPLGLEVASPVGSSQWGQELGRQLVTISHDARQGHHTAELRLDPPDLGPLRVSINLHEGVASAAFVSVHAAVRQAVEAALPQLQQALAQAGISLGQTSVGDQSAQQGFAEQQGRGAGAPGGSAAGADSETVVVAATPARNADALVDTFA
ncbi:flagellar hook-length control protein FliK, partial [Bordetella bronchiseptica]